MKRFLLPSAALCIVSAAVLAFSSGCESAEANDITVVPSTAKVVSGQSVRLEASGWGDFRWSLSNAEIGVLSGTVGKSVVYTATASGPATQRVTATAIGSGSSGSSSTNRTASVSGYSGTAVITHQ